MFNIFKKFVKKEENEKVQEQNTFESVIEEIPEFEEHDLVIEAEEPVESKVFSIEELETDSFHESVIEEIPEFEEHDLVIEAEEPVESKVFSIEELETDSFHESVIEEIPEFDENDLEIEAEEPVESKVFSIEELETDSFHESVIEEIPEVEEHDLIIETEESVESKVFSIEELETDSFQESLIEENPEVEEHDLVIATEEPVEAEVFSIEELEPKVTTSEPEKQGFFGISFAGLKQAISKTSEFLNTDILSLCVGKETIDDDMLDEMEEKFIRADVGVDTTVYIIERLRENKNKVKPNKLGEYLKNEFKEIIKAPGSNNLNLKSGQLNTFLITGVNGAGKTTLIGKLAYRFKSEGKKVLVAAGDTFRAAAEDQLEIWAERAGADIVRQDGADPASVVFDSLQKAKSENYDILLIDTAGRLHNKFNLMEELRKIKKVIDKESPESLVESILVLDATTGQNGLKQAEVFKEAVDLSCVGLTKLDGTAKGGVILGIARQLNMPVKLIGVGEKMEDLRDFNADDFIEALF